MIKAVVKTPDESVISSAVSLISSGQPIVFPTETVYGLAADAKNDLAIQKLYEIKGRDANKPLQIMVPTLNEARKIGFFDKKAEALARNFWPGPLTIIVKKSADAPISDLACPPSGTIGIRIPAHDVAMKILQVFGRPMAATSANISGAESTVTAAGAADSVGDLVPLIIDGGPCAVGVSSTVVDVSSGTMKILRVGSVSEAEINATLSKI